MIEREDEVPLMGKVKELAKGMMAWHEASKDEYEIPTKKADKFN